MRAPSYPKNAVMHVLLALTCALLGMSIGCGDDTSAGTTRDLDAATPHQGGRDGGVAVAADAPAVDGAVESPTTVDMGSLLDGVTDAAMTTPDAGACSYDISEIGQHYWNAPCPTSIAEIGQSRLPCDGGVWIYDTRCGQREVLMWSWGSHSQTCFYEAGSLVGLVLSDDIASFCNRTARFIEIGATAGCPDDTSTGSLICL